MDWIRILIFIVGFLFISLILALVIPPYKEDTSYTCIVTKEGVCQFPQVWNPVFFGVFALLSLIFLIMSLATFTYSAQFAYIMSLPEALNKISNSNKIIYKIPPVSMIIPELIRPLDGGKRMYLEFQNPLDNYKTYHMILNMMSDYAISTTETKQVDPILAYSRSPLSWNGARQLLYSQEKSVAAKLANIDRIIERQNLGSDVTRDLLEEDAERRKEKLREKATTI